MTKQYEYVVLRLSPDAMRGETINIGFIVFPEHTRAFVRITAPQSKMRALDPLWSASNEAKLRNDLEPLIFSDAPTTSKVALLAGLGFCVPGEPGFFYATEAELDNELRQLAQQYISMRRDRGTGNRRNKLHHEMLVRFKSMHLLGADAEDLYNHRVVAHLPIPGSPDLKGDFVYKNGVYRITQTLDYRVSPMGARQKVSEACTKVMAAQEGEKVWGPTTEKYALVNVPTEVADIADSHLQLLYSSGFEVFHADKPRELERYHQVAFEH